MILQGRNLELNMRGDDVSLLQDELRQLDFDIDESEASFGTTTLLAVETFQRQHDLRVNGVVDAITARAINLAVDTLSGNLYLVKGTIVRVDGSPVVRARVALHERKLRSEESLGESTSDGQGAFEITYPQPQETPLSVLVRAFSRDGQEIAASNLICNVKPVEEVTLVVGGEVLRGPSEYTQLESILRPALAAEQLDPASLNEEDVTFLACKFDLDPEQVALFVVSARHHRETDIKAEAFYGLMRQGLSSDLKTLIAQSQETLRDALVTATEENIISPELEASIPRILSQLQHQIVRLALQDPDPDRPTFTALFDIAGVESRHRQRSRANK